jgi:threonine synthase
MPKENYHYHCVNCGKDWDAKEFRYLCPDCSKGNSIDAPPKGVLLMHYDDISHVEQYSEDELLLQFWPLESRTSLPPLKIGHTPLYTFRHLSEEILEYDLLIKDDSQNPSYSFKDRASTLVSAYAKEHQIDTIVTASTGNAGSSLAAVCASQQQKAIILLPKAAPLAKLVQVEMYGAQLIKVDGNYDQAFDESIQLSEKNGWFNRNTAYNPLTIEGKKSVSFEIYEQLGKNIPDLVFVPVGDGVIISGVFKGFEDLLKCGLIDRMPKIVAVQAEKSANIVENLHSDNLSFPAATTKADSISVDIPRNFYVAKHFLLTYESGTITVSDQQIMQAALKMSSSYGIFPEPASAAAFAGYLKYKEEQEIARNSQVLVLHTGSGLKDVANALSFLEEKAKDNKQD